MLSSLRLSFLLVFSLSQFAATTRTVLLSGGGFWLLLLAGCAVIVPQVPTPAADPAAGATTAPPRSVLGVDDATRKTEQLLAASGATRLEGLKPMKHEMSMGGMEHHGGMESMPGMDHSKMPGMQKQPSAGTPAGKHEPGGMEGMDHSKMPAGQNSRERNLTPKPKESTGTSTDHGAHADHEH